MTALKEDDLKACIEPIMCRVAPASQGLFWEAPWPSKQSAGIVCVGAIKAKRSVLSQVAEELLSESEAKVPSIERRLHRFVSNERIDVEAVWEDFLGPIGG